MNFFKFTLKQFCQNVSNRSIPNPKIFKEIKISDFDLDSDTRLDKFMLRRFKVNWSIVQKLIRTRKIFILKEDGIKITEATAKLEKNDKIYLPKDIIVQEEMKTIEIVKKLNDEEKEDYKQISRK